MPLTPTDRIEIQDLYATYCHAVDDLDGERWAELFTSDGVFAPSVGSGTGKEFRGREVLARFAADPNRHNASRHWNNNLLLAERDDHVEGTCYAMLVDISGDAPVPVAHVVYHDQLVREDGRWRFRSRRPKRDV
jgi:hypothetical protein